MPPHIRRLATTGAVTTRPIRLRVVARRTDHIVALDCAVDRVPLQTVRDVFICTSWLLCVQTAVARVQAAMLSVVMRKPSRPFQEQKLRRMRMRLEPTRENPRPRSLMRGSAQRMLNAISAAKTGWALELREVITFDC